MDPSQPSCSGRSSGRASNMDENDSDGSIDPLQRIVNNTSESSSDEDTSEDEADIEVVCPTWSIHTGGLRRIEFARVDSLLVPIPGTGSPIDFFNLLLDDIFLQNICKLSNSYAFNDVYARPNLTPRSRINAWKDLTVPELKTFLGVLIHTGTIKMNRVQDYWKTDYLFNLKCFSSFMSRDRFLSILRCLHFSRPSGNDTDHDNPTEKIKFVVEYFNNKMKSVYYPQKELSLDEAMVLWRGRLHSSQYIQGKRHKYGVKLYTLTEHQGFILKFLLYSGRSDNVVGGKGHTEKVVLNLLKDYLGHGHSVYTDNCYNSYALASKLLSQNTYCTGTLRSDRKFIPKEVSSKSLKKGETIARYANGVMIGKWRDKRTVLYISTEHDNQLVDCTDKRGRSKQKPLPIVKYNAHMSGVDRADQMMSYHPCERKTIRWYKKIFIHVIMMIMTNSHLLYNTHNKKMNLYDFRLEVIKSLLPPPLVESPAQKRKRNEAHKLVKIAERDHNNRTKRKKCRQCTNDGKHGVKTTFQCESCPDKPGLCMGQCFQAFHDRLV
ncbi:piggyBac transposable element-derived protein 4-like [Homalodisca vitripennis]|uniref:piggyBac transposable element-derived protein 4-like n=1 Tax=Homalodisca vitripennis TaxID=197043 RepID=UPI001EEA8E8F|nr:piggyBac transposable element-derived protein 4-like [Homalodisca vitripennis]